MESLLKKFGTFVLVAAIILGIRVYKQISTHTEVKEKIISLCEGDIVCQHVVEKNFEECFDKNYSKGGRRRSGSLNQENFLRCINTKTKEPLFSIKDA